MRVHPIPLCWDELLSYVTFLHGIIQTQIQFGALTLKQREGLPKLAIWFLKQRLHGHRPHLGVFFLWRVHLGFTRSFAACGAAADPREVTGCPAPQGLMEHR